MDLSRISAFKIYSTQLTQSDPYVWSLSDQSDPYP